MRHKQINTVLSFILVFFLIFLVIPAFFILRTSFYDGHFTLEHFHKVFTNQKLYVAFFNSVHVSLVSAVLTTFLAFILAYTEGFTNIPVWTKKLLRTLSVFPMLLPTITYGFLIIYSFGKTGLITKIFGRTFFDFYGYRGLVFSYVVYTLPISFTLIRNTMNYIDKRYIVVCRLMGSGPLETFRLSVLFPLWNTLAISVVQAFFLSFTDFGIPASIAGNYPVIAKLLYNTMLGSVPDFGSGSVVALVMLLPSILSILLLNYLQRYNVRYSKVSSRVETRRNIPRDVVLGLASFIIISAILSIFLVLFVSPFVRAWPYDLHFSLENFRAVVNDSSLFRVYKNSLSVSLLTAIFGTILVYAAALVTSRSRLHPHGNLIIGSVAQVTNTAPGMVLGIAFLLAFNKTPLKNTIFILVFCNMIHFFATPYLMMKSTLDKLNESFEATATILGDNWIKCVARIITPNVSQTLLEVFSYLFINGMVTVSAVIFIAGARTMLTTTKIQELQHFAKFNEIFILSIFILFTNLFLKLLKGIANMVGKSKS